MMIFIVEEKDEEKLVDPLRPLRLLLPLPQPIRRDSPTKGSSVRLEVEHFYILQ